MTESRSFFHSVVYLALGCEIMFFMKTSALNFPSVDRLALITRVWLFEGE